MTIKTRLKCSGIKYRNFLSDRTASQQQKMRITLITKEIERRQRLFNAISYVDIAIDVKPSQLRDLGIYGGAAGVWVNSDGM
jgi:hypothetical protein